MSTYISVMPDSGDSWLDEAACKDLDINSFFVQAGHIISDDILNLCRACPVREHCVKHSFNEKLNITGGYFGGLSPGQRRVMSLDEALEYIKEDTVEKPKKPAIGDDVYAPFEDEYDDEPIEYS